MKIAVSESLPLLTKWIDEVVMPKSTTAQKFIITLALLQRGSELPVMLQPLADKDGYLDLDHVAVALEKAGGRIELPYINWVFDKDDLSRLTELAKNGASN